MSIKQQPHQELVSNDFGDAVFVANKIVAEKIPLGSLNIPALKARGVPPCDIRQWLQLIGLPHKTYQSLIQEHGLDDEQAAAKPLRSFKVPTFLREMCQPGSIKRASENLEGRGFETNLVGLAVTIALKTELRYDIPLCWRDGDNLLYIPVGAHVKVPNNLGVERWNIAVLVCITADTDEQISRLRDYDTKNSTEHVTAVERTLGVAIKDYPGRTDDIVVQAWDMSMGLPVEAYICNLDWGFSVLPINISIDDLLDNY